MKRWQIWAVVLLALAAHIAYYCPYFVDDVFISLRYSARLLAGHGLTWNDGERVEGYSNLLWVLLMAGFGGLGINMVWAARLMCLASTLATLAALSFYQRRHLPGKPSAFLVGGLGLALSAPVAIWSIGGMESTFVMMLMAWSYLLSLEQLPQEKPALKLAACNGLLLGLVCLTRPEGPLFTLITAAGWLLFAAARRRLLVKPLLLVCGIPALFYLAQLAFRLSYYGEWLPNTYYVKVAWTLAHLINGVFYVVKGGIALYLPLLLGVAMVADRVIRDSDCRRMRRAWGFLTFASLAWLVMVMAGGGDFFPGFRHVLPAVPAFLYMTEDAFTLYLAVISAKRVYAMFAYLLACLFAIQWLMPKDIDAHNTRLMLNGRRLGEYLEAKYKNAREKPLIAVVVAGIIPYYAEDLPFLDMLGLTDRVIAHTHGARFGHGFIAHELFNSKLILARKPDIIIFYFGQIPPIFGIDKMPEFANYYRPEIVHLPNYDAEIWLRKDSKKIGLTGE